MCTHVYSRYKTHRYTRASQPLSTAAPLKHIAHAHTHTHTCTYTEYKHACKRFLFYTNSCVHVCERARNDDVALALPPLHGHTLADSHSIPCLCPVTTHTCIDAHTHIHTRTHTHIYTCARILYPPPTPFSLCAKPLAYPPMTLGESNSTSQAWLHTHTR